MNKTDGDLIDKVLLGWAQEVCKGYRKKMEGVRVSGHLYNTASYGIKDEGNSKVAYLQLDEYWKYIESGRKPGTYPPVDAIKEWIQTKKIIPQPYILPNGKQKLPTDNQLAFLIGRKIAESGIASQPFLCQTIKEYELELLIALGDALRDEVKKRLEIDFNS